jgi:hypothetical protein
LLSAVISNELAIQRSRHQHLDHDCSVDPAVSDKPAHLECELIQQIISPATPWSASPIPRPFIRKLAERIAQSLLGVTPLARAWSYADPTLL